MEKAFCSLFISGGGASLGSKSFLPNGLAIASIKIDGTGPSGLCASASAKLVEGSSFDFELVPGAWEFRAAGLSAEGGELAVGLLRLDLAPGERAEGTIILLPAQGAGSVSLSWTLVGSVDPPLEVEGALRPDAGAATSILCAFDTGSLRIEGLAAGRYSLELRLRSGGQAVCGLADTLLVAAGMETQAAVVFEPPLAKLGLAALLPNFSAAELELEPAKRRVAVGLGTAFRSAAQEPLAWYLDGQVLSGIASRLELAAPGAAGLRRLDCVAAGPSRAGGHGRAFLDVEEAVGLGTLSWIETIARDDEAVSSPAYAKALGDCRDLAWSAEGFLAAAGRASNAVTLLEASAAGAVFVDGSVGGAAEPRLISPCRLRFLTEGSIVAISDTEGAAYSLGVAEDGLSLCDSLSDALLAGAADLAVAEGGGQVYVAAPDADAVALLRIGAAGVFESMLAAAIKDSGALSSFSKPGCLALDPAGAILAVGTRGDDALYLFAREASGGSLSLASRIDKTAFDAFGSLSDPCSLAFSPDGTSLFVLSYYGKAVFRLDKDPVSGVFSPVASAKSGLGGVTGFATPKGLAVAPDASLLALAGGGAADGLALFDVSAPGALAFQGALLPSDGVALPSRPSALAFSPDGRFLALAADGFLSVFRAKPDR